MQCTTSPVEFSVVHEQDESDKNYWSSKNNVQKNGHPKVQRTSSVEFSFIHKQEEPQILWVSHNNFWENSGDKTQMGCKTRQFR